MESARPQSSQEQERAESGEEDTQKLYIVQSSSQTSTLERKTVNSTTPSKTPQRTVMTRGKAVLFIGLLLILVLNAVNAGYAQFIVPQGSAFVIGWPASSCSNDSLTSITNQLKH